MSALRKILLTGGPDASQLRVVDADTGEVIVGVVKIELLCTPDGGALVNVTQACRIEAIDLVARDVGEPLIDLPDDHPEVKAAEGLNATFARVRAATAEALKVPAHARQQALDAAGVRTARVAPPTANPAAEMAQAAIAALTPDVPVLVVPPKETRHRRTKAEMITARTPVPAPIAEPPPLPVVPTESARRAPPPESEPEPDLSEPEKGELAQLLAKAVAEAIADEPRGTLPPGTPWPFDSTPRLGSLLGTKGGR